MQISVSALMLGLVLAGSAVAQDQSVASHQAARIDINALSVESDFTVFMCKDVPEDLRRRALRKLWTLMSVPSCHDHCYAEPAAAGLPRVASETRTFVAQ